MGTLPFGHPLTWKPRSTASEDVPLVDDDELDDMPDVEDPAGPLAGDDEVDENAEVDEDADIDLLDLEVGGDDEELSSEDSTDAEG